MSKQILIGTGDKLIETITKIDLMFDELYNSIQVVKTSQLENDANFITANDITDVAISSITGLETQLQNITESISSDKIDIDARLDNIIVKFDELKEMFNANNRYILTINNTISKFNNRLIQLENAPNNTALE